MIFLNRKRFLLWLLKAYIRKWGKTILLSFFIGLIIFIIVNSISGFFLGLFPFKHEDKIGIVGSFTVNTLPYEVVGKMSKGLTSLSNDGFPKTSVAYSWEIEDSGKTYIFHLKHDLYFSDNSKVDSSSINYNFLDVKVEKPDQYTIVFKLKEPYAPFLITVSKPIFKKSFIGIGDYKVKSWDFNGEFVKSIELFSIKDKRVVSYQFYPTDKALKIALVLGEISKASQIQDINFLNTTFYSFPNYSINKKTSNKQLATIFYNNKDKILSDKRLREALSYSVPDSFSDGERNKLPYPPNLWINYGGIEAYQQDFDHAKNLLAESEASNSAHLTLTIKTLAKYEKVAEEIKDSWKFLGIRTSIEKVDSLPSSFQIFLGEFNVPQDPDQYALWHSSQPNNITGYRNLRIDKLLEDGRQTQDLEKRDRKSTRLNSSH